MASIKIVSSSLLTANQYQPTFSPVPVHDVLFFNDGPRTLNTRIPPSGSQEGAINTKPIDPFTQGVEITRQVQYDAGLAKIWSGEAGHVLKPNTFGQTKNFFPDPGFADIDLFIPQRFLAAQTNSSPLWQNVLTFPIIIGDSDQIESFSLNGIIEPLTIRAAAAFSSIDAPLESHAVRGNFGSGNSDQLNGSDQVVTVYVFEPKRQIVGYLDMVDIIEGHPLNGFFRYEFTALLPFNDERLVRNVPVSQETVKDAGMLAALSVMTGSTSNYISFADRSAACGWGYDNNGTIGTDSLPFGGMTY